MNKRTFLTKLLLACLIILMCVPVAAFAEEESGSGGTIVVYMHSVEDGTVIPDAEVALYKIANYSGEAITVIPELDAYITFDNLIDETIESAEKIDKALIDAGIEPVAFATSDAAGYATFKNVPDAIYYIRLVKHEDVDLSYNRVVNMASFVVPMPSLNDDGTFSREHNCRPKCEISNTVHVFVKKVWKDSGHENERPQMITVSLYRDNSLVETISLSDENSWKYEWPQLPAGGDYTLKENDVPNLYKSTVTEDEENNFVVTNVYNDDDVPATGDNMNLPFWGIMFTIGLVLLAAFIFASIERKDKKDVE